MPADAWPQLIRLLLTGRPVVASEAVGWLVDYAGPLESAIRMAWDLASGTGDGVERRPLEEGPLAAIPDDVGELPELDGDATDAARKAILDCVRASGEATLSEALGIQARHAAEFLAGEVCRRGVLGAEYMKTMKV